MTDTIPTDYTMPFNEFILRQETIEQRLEDHISESESHRAQNQEMFDKLLDAQNKNTEAIGELTKATAGVIEVYTASQGAIKVGSAVGRFVKWLSSIAIIGVGFKWVWDHLGGPPFTS